MRHKPVLNLAIALIQALLLTTSASAFASTEADQEIGIPQPMETRAKGCFGVVLSPDGDGFYSVRDGLLTHYQIDPFKKTASVTIDEAQLKDIPEKDRCRVLITDDRSKLILVYPDWLISLDRGSGKVTKKVERKGELKDSKWLPSEAVTVNENDLVFLVAAPIPSDDGGHGGTDFRLTILDAKSFQFKKKLLNLNERFGFSGSYENIPFITKIQNKLYLSSNSGLAVLNGKTYEPELALLRRAGSVSGIKISKDYRKLYVANVWSFRDYLTKTEKNSASPLEDSDVVFDQETKQVTYEKNSFNKLTKDGPLRDQMDPLLFTRNPSRNNNYVTASLREYALVRSRKTGSASFFYQYESSEAILVGARYEGTRRVESFQLTPGARQYLMMKTSTGKLAPINDITFNQYLSTESRR